MGSPFLFDLNITDARTHRTNTANHTRSREQDAGDHTIDLSIARNVHTAGREQNTLSGHQLLRGQDHKEMADPRVRQHRATDAGTEIPGPVRDLRIDQRTA